MIKDGVAAPLAAFMNEDGTVNYKLWKKARRDLIQGLSPKMQSFSEEKLQVICEVWDRRMDDEATTHDLIAQKLLIISMSFFFFRNLEWHVTVLNRFLVFVDDAVPIMTQLMCSTLRFVSRCSPLGPVLFAPVYDAMERWISTDVVDQHWFAVMKVLKVTSKCAPELFFRFMGSHKRLIFGTCRKAEGEICKYSMYDISAYIKMLDAEKHPDLLNLVSKLLMGLIGPGNTPGDVGLALDWIAAVAQRHGPSHIDFDLVVKVFEDKELYDKLERKKSLLELMAVYDPILKIDATKFLVILLDTEVSLFPEFIKRWGNRIDAGIILDNTYRAIEENVSKCPERCIYREVPGLIRYVDGYKPDPDRICEGACCCTHFIDCIIDNEYMLTDSVLERFECFLSGNCEVTDMEMTCSLRIAKAFSSRFKDLNNRLIGLKKRIRNGSTVTRSVFIKAIELIGDADLRNGILVEFMISDPDKGIRLQAVLALTVTLKLAYNHFTYQVLNDSSFRVRRAGLMKVVSCFEFNALDKFPRLYAFTEQIFRVLRDESDIVQAAKAARLLCTLSTHIATCSKCGALYSGDVITACLELLAVRIDHTLEASGKGAQGGGRQSDVTIAKSLVRNLRVPLGFGLQAIGTASSEGGDRMNLSYGLELGFNDYVSHSKVNAGHRHNILGSNEHRVSLRARVFEACAPKALKKRDTYLIKTLAVLGKLCEPHLTRVLKTFSAQIETRTNEKYLTVVVRSLSRLAVNVFNGLNIRLRCPEIMQPLYRLLGSANSNALAVEIVKLFGNGFDIVECTDDDYYSMVFISNMNNETYTGFVLSTIMHYIGNANVSALKSLAIISENDSELAGPFTSHIITLFISTIDNSPTSIRSTLFGYLGAICQSLQREIPLVISELEQLVMKYLSQESCIKFCATLCARYSMELSGMSSRLMSPVLCQLSASQGKMFSYSLKLVVVLVIQQRQSVERLLSAIEDVQYYDDYITRKIFNAMVVIVHNCDVSMYCARIGILVTRRMSASYDFIAKSIAVMQNIPVSQLRDQFSETDFSGVEEYVEKSRSSSFDGKPFMERVTLQCHVGTLIPEFTPREAFFADFVYPKEEDIDEFLMKVKREIIEFSPLAEIRSCYVFMEMRVMIFEKVVPVAFLAAWKSTSAADRDRFSEIVNRILAEHSTVNNMILDLIQLLDRNLVPFKIDVTRLAGIAHVRPLVFYLLHRRYIVDGDKSVLPMLMETVTKMNKIETLRSYSSRCDSLSKTELATYCGYMGDWEQALAIVQDMDSVGHVVKCLEKLKRYDDIMDLECKYNSMNDCPERRGMASAFIWAFLRYRENTKIEKAIENLGSALSSDLYYVIAVYLISIKEYAKAERCLDQGFAGLAMERKQYTTGDRYQMRVRFSYAQTFYECYETLKLKKRKHEIDEDLSNSWQHHINFFNRDEKAWESTIVLRNVVFPIHDHLPLYIPVISALRKAGHLNLIQQYFVPAFDYNVDGEILTETLKLMRAYGDDKACFEICQSSVWLIQSAAREEWLSISSDQLISDPFPFLVQYTKQAAFDSYARDYMADYFGVSSVTDAMRSLRALPKKKQSQFFVEIINRFPTQLFKCFSSIMIDGRISGDSCYSLCHIYAKSSLSLFSDSVSAMKLSSKYFRVALYYNPDAYKSWCGWAYVNFRLYTMLRSDPTRVDETQINDFDFDAAADERYLQERGLSLPTREQEIDELRRMQKGFNSAGPKPANVNGLTDVLDSGMSSANGGNRNDRAPMFRGRWEEMGRMRRLVWKQFECKIEDIEEYGVNAIIGYLKAAELRPSRDFEHRCRVLSILFSIDGFRLLTDEIIHQITSISGDCVVSLVPNIAPHIDHPSETVRHIVRTLLVSAGHVNFQCIFFALNLYAHDGSQVATDILESLRVSNEHTVSDAKLFFDGMVQAACTWFESWKNALEDASHSNDRDSILAAKFEEFMHPQNETDEYFVKLYSNVILECRSLFRQHTESSLKCMWGKLIDLHGHLKERVNKLCVILLPKVAPALAKKRGFNISAMSSGHEGLIDYIDPTMEVLGTQQHPRCTFFVTRSGRRVKFLLKAGEDLRLDERLMQFFTFVNSLIKNQRGSLSAFINIYNIVPLTTNVGLLRWVTDADTLQQIIVEGRKLRNFPVSTERDICSKHTSAEFDSLSAVQRLEIFDKVSKVCRGLELFELMWLKAPNATQWAGRIERYTSSTALMSMVGHIIGLGDRHPSNIMIQRSTGDVVHIDFGEAFESTITRETHPEKVPFRLTRVLVNAFEGSSTDGLFEARCVKTMKLLRRYHRALTIQLAIFLKEPVGRAISRKNRAKQDIVDRIAGKLDGSEFGDKVVSVETQVRKLIDIAQDPANYVCHYSGWCPFW